VIKLADIAAVDQDAPVEDHAVTTARVLGPVLPVAPGGKAPPMVARGVYAATRDEATIREWWERWPDANLALAMGHPVEGTGMVLIAIDEDEDGALDAFEDRCGPLPATLASRTPNGRHLLYLVSHADAQRIGNRVRAVKGIDVRAGGGYVVVAPSSRPDGAYVWERPVAVPAVLPDAHVKALARADVHGRAWRTAYDREVDLVGGVDHGAGDTIPVGARNSALFSIGCDFRRRGYDEASIRRELDAINGSRCEEPLGFEEMETIATQAAAHPTAEELALASSARIGEDRALTPAQTRIGRAICARAAQHASTIVTYPIRELEADCGSDRKTILKAIAELERAGHVVAHRAERAGRKLPTAIELRTETLPDSTIGANSSSLYAQNTDGSLGGVQAVSHHDVFRHNALGPDALEVLKLLDRHCLGLKVADITDALGRRSRDRLRELLKRMEAYGLIERRGREWSLGFAGGSHELIGLLDAAAEDLGVAGAREAARERHRSERDLYHRNARRYEALSIGRPPPEPIYDDYDHDPEEERHGEHEHEHEDAGEAQVSAVGEGDHRRRAGAPRRA
jgi:hypothetical protein